MPQELSDEAIDQELSSDDVRRPAHVCRCSALSGITYAVNRRDENAVYLDQLGSVRGMSDEKQAADAYRTAGISPDSR